MIFHARATRPCTVSGTRPVATDKICNTDTIKREKLQIQIGEMPRPCMVVYQNILKKERALEVRLRSYFSGSTYILS